MTSGAGTSRYVVARSSARSRIRTVIDAASTPVAAYYLLLGSAGLLLAFGLIMVLSASSVAQLMLTGSSYTMFKKQLLFAGVGVVGAVVAANIPVRWWKRLTLPAFGLAIALQVLVLLMGIEVNGNTNWLAIGGQRVQPSEFGKLALVLLCAMILAHKRRVIGNSWQAIFPLVPLGLVLVSLVLAGGDMGTTMVLMAILAGTLFAAGARLRLFVISGVLAAVAGTALIIQAPHRIERVRTWITDSCNDPKIAVCYQKMHGQYALADGGWWGVGLGRSVEKWGYLPEPHNDFIFAIIGEEMGMAGTLTILALFVAIGFACYRIVAQSEDAFVRIAAAGIMVWLLGQAVINIGSVIGLLPIVGVPLPLVSSGGTALVSSLVAVGILVSFARQHPDVRQLRGLHSFARSLNHKADR